MKFFRQAQFFILRFEKLFLVMGSATLLTLVLMSLEFNLLESHLYDFRVVRSFQRAPHSDIVLIRLDDNTVKKLNDFPPLALDVHVQFLEKLELASPQAVGYLINMNHVSQSNPELFQQSWGQRFVSAAQKLESKGIPFIMGTPYDVNGEVLPPFPLSTLKHAMNFIHRDETVFSGDKVTRRAWATLYGKPTFPVTMAQALGHSLVENAPDGSFDVPMVDGKFFFFRYHGNPTKSFQDNDPSPDSGDQYVSVSFVDVLEGRVPSELLKGKIILVGSSIKEQPSDFVLTPFNKTTFVAPSLVVHANILDSVLKNYGVWIPSNWINALATFVLTAAVISWVLSTTPLYGIFIPASLAVAYSFFCLLLFNGFLGMTGIWLKMSQPLAGIFVGYYLVVPYRLIREYKKRWEYQRKNELLTQVEELKTNFLRLVTHDLKTPVARIQGLSEVLSKKASERLNEQDKGIVGQIFKATDELNHFITGVLELTRIESDQIQLHLEVKDINRIVEISVEALEPKARAKEIEISLELEPLFPISLDPSLISKVIRNLIDNAIKYSPEHSKITIRSLEVDRWVEVSITDQGIGISEEEKKHLFGKFYRANNNAASTISGAGLGLYLTKYFVEAHQGQVTVVSELGKGSEFKILLPLESLSHGRGLTVKQERSRLASRSS